MIGIFVLGVAIKMINPTAWGLLFAGCALYWLNKLNDARKLDTTSWWSVNLNQFFIVNMFKIPYSLLACVVLGFIMPEIPPSLMVTKGIISIVSIGYMNSSLLNSIIAKGKTEEEKKE